ncbi:hypothetical protein BDP55DRAFT_179408 [Colletotrichum godetiae]|uniref:Uncharacterized protein n=1 Tax=Colletotrichum godetiae TaxID=1209918 RepID=A0AAJ0AMV0_9PEZI|nr:uncharacterized protein BDP55DRAFT_179408 [Colletotrichum godetiae]KAK1674626.1 hypothetical protein BDP55DRAFT_179408 [Colletotrichum godetiae]
MTLLHGSLGRSRRKFLFMVITVHTTVTDTIPILETRMNGLSWEAQPLCVGRCTYVLFLCATDNPHVYRIWPWGYRVWYGYGGEGAFLLN